MKKFLQRILRNPVSRLADKYSSRPDKKRVHSSLSKLYRDIKSHPGKKGPVIDFGSADSFIILSDQHKGAKDHADDFMLAENNYLAALDYYNKNNFFYINLGDSEDLWENTLALVKANNQASFEKEKLFINRNAFVKIFGNHDLYWDNDPLAAYNLKEVYGQEVKIYEGAVLRTQIAGKPLQIYMTHGHQGDLQSDGNWLTKWFVSTIWAPFQAYLELNPNTPANNDLLKTDHNRFMYEWSIKHPDMLLITGHTHQPVFQSLTHLEDLYRKLNKAQESGDKLLTASIESELTALNLKKILAPDFTTYQPTYFNSGCCCFNDGDITGIEICNASIRLVKWEYDEQKNPVRRVLNEAKLEGYMDC